MRGRARLEPCGVRAGEEQLGRDGAPRRGVVHVAEREVVQREAAGVVQLERARGVVRHRVVGLERGEALWELVGQDGAADEGGRPDVQGHRHVVVGVPRGLEEVLSVLV